MLCYSLPTFCYSNLSSIQVIFNFHESKYGKCLKLLEEIRDNLMLDMYLAGHVNNLYSMIRNRGLIQYFR